ncbi:hypothetical protein HHL11_10085 [Ramlibacter sp. G-1-2-2]|uniref:Uncharacterized protein n=1 Tax=Ramlibacter agri TaxID=2728837 RepID=A0A848H8W5_9BURK|nr:hypothetical protein [Ramlibacter agri]NML44098.1 hypothetical protein [Ramlibacter agri]
MSPVDHTDSEQVHSADRLRTAANVFGPDQRSHAFKGPHVEPVPPELEQRLRDISQFELSPGVPVRIRIHFETARNLYAYSWFVYRFHMVAQQHALATLELALRCRFFPPDGHTDNSKATLRPLLARAVKEGLLSSERFGVVQRTALQRARDRQWQEAIRKLSESGVDFVETDERDAMPLPDDYRSEWLQDWVEIAPKLRNMHAHGTTSLSPAVLGTFENVMDAINQLWSPRASTG